MTNYAYKCRTCGSEDVVRDAWAIWNKEKQEYELYATYDHAWCLICDEGVSLEEVEI